ncbi:HET-domain-containing protein, partial [Ophiobolus disseminans]
MARPASPYSPIVSQHGQTRVIELDPGAYDDTLNLRLRTVALPEYLDYEALSYVWGTHLCYQPAYVDGYETIITANLDVALRHFRRLHVSRTLWVDAISINQEDTEERGHQVQIMRDIYSSAREVLIWLGPLADQQQQDALAWVELDHIPASLGDRTTLIHGLRRLCQRPWFTRVWVIQEMALAKNEPIMHLGPRTVLWSHLVSYFQRVRNLQTKEYGLGAWPSSPDGRLTTFGSLYHNLYLPELRTMRNHYSLFTNAFNTRSLFSTDPRDMIFGLLGVS